MTVEERLAVVESRIADLKGDQDEIKKMLIDLKEIAAMGKGALFLAFKVGAFLVGGFAVAKVIFDLVMGKH